MYMNINQIMLSVELSMYPATHYHIAHAHTSWPTSHASSIMAVEQEHGSRTTRFTALLRHHYVFLEVRHSCNLATGYNKRRVRVAIGIN